MAKISRIKKQKPDLSKKDIEKDIIKINPWKKNSKIQSNARTTVNEGQVSIHTKSVSFVDGVLSASFSINNGLSRKVKLKELPLFLVDSDKRVLARQLFTGEPIGEIDGSSSKACVARFLPENVYVQDVPEKCKVCFDKPAKRPQNTKIEYQTLPKHNTEIQKQELEKVLANLPPMKRGGVSFSPLHVKFTTNNDLIATVIVRNFANKRIKLEQVPLIVLDAHREELARGKFDIKGLTIEPFKAMLLTLNFGPISQDREVDLSSWSINVIK